MQKIIVLLMLCLVGSHLNLSAQEEKEVKKIIIIKKTDDNGNVIEEKFESEDGEFSSETRKKLREMRMTMKDSVIGDEIRIEIHKDGPQDGDRKRNMVWKKAPKKPKAAWGPRDMKMEREIIRERADSKEMPRNKAVIGIGIDDTDYGVKVTEIMPGSAAESAGLRRGDILLKVNNNFIFTSNGLLEALHPFNPGDKVKLKYLREGKEKSATLKLTANK
jgi:type II secretory pathway component PulC